MVKSRRRLTQGKPPIYDTAMKDTMHVKLPAELIAWLRRKAKEEDRTPGGILRRIAMERMRQESAA